MTLILAVGCREGLVLASDGQATISTGGQPVKGYVDKLYQPWNNVVWGGSGPTGIIQQVDHALRTAIPNSDDLSNLSIHDVRARLGTVVAVTVRNILNNRWVNVPNAQPWSSYLFAGHVPEGSFILEVHDNLTDTDHTATGFAAIGSGDIFPYFAMAGVKHFNVNDRSLLEARLITYRILQDAIGVAAFGLGPPIQMIQIAKRDGAPGDASRVGQDELDAIANQVTEWRQLESDALAEFVGIATRVSTVSTAEDAVAARNAMGVTNSVAPDASASNEAST